MLVLCENCSGFGLFKVLDETKLKEVDSLYTFFETPELASSLLKLVHFRKFADTTEALAAATATVEGKIPKSLKSMIKKYVENGTQLAVVDSKLATAIKGKFELQCLSNNAIQELVRGIRTQLDSLVEGLSKKDLTQMTLGLAHSLSRYKLKFSPDKVDTMVIHGISMLDDLDKALNNMIMRCREWYSWHFPELNKIVTDNLAFVNVVKLIGTRDHAAETDLSDVLPEDVEEKVKELAEVSMGTEISHHDLMNIHELCDQILDNSKARDQLNDYINTRMMSITPNLSVMLGELVGARLLAKSGSLINLAKQPASTIQLLGSEKALFRALKTKKDTPKYGLIYHSPLLAQTSTKNKGKMARMLAAKTALAIRADAFGEEEDSTVDLGLKHKVTLERRLRFLEERNNTRLSGTAKAKAKLEKYNMSSTPQQYPAAADSTLTSAKRKREDDDTPLPKKAKKPKIEVLDDANDSMETETPTKKKKKKHHEEPEVKVEEAKEDAPTEKKKKKKRSLAADKEAEVKEEAAEEVDVKEEVAEEAEIEEVVEETSSKKKKKRRKSEVQEVEEPEMQTPVSEKKKQKNKGTVEQPEEEATPSSEKKKKKKKKNISE